MTGGQDMLREALEFTSRIEAAGAIEYEAENFVAWKETARDLAPRLRAALSAQRDTSGAVDHVGDLHRKGVSDGERLCSHGEAIPEGEPLYWMQAISQYDDSDPYCFEHARERAEERGHDLLPTPAAASFGEGMREALILSQMLLETIDRTASTNFTEVRQRIIANRLALARDAAGVDGVASVVVPREREGDRDLYELLSRKFARVHPSNQGPDTPLLLKATYGQVARLRTAIFALLAAAPIAQPAEEDRHG